MQPARTTASSDEDRRLANLRPFAPSTSGNPTGRPKGQKGFAALIRSRVHQGRDLVDFVLGLMHDPDVDPRVRLDAATWLANRAFGPADPGTELTVFRLRIGERPDDD